MQHINLFRPAFIPAPPQLSFRRLVQILFLALSLMLIYTLQIQHRLLQQRAQTQDARMLLQSLQDKIVAIQAPNPETDTQMNNTVLPIDSARQLQQAQMLLKVLQQHSHESHRGFSSILQGLQRTRDASVRVSTVHIAHEHLQLAGNSSSAAAIPLWLAQLAQQPELTAFHFGQLHIENAGQLNTSRIWLFSINGASLDRSEYDNTERSLGDRERGAGHVQ